MRLSLQPRRPGHGPGQSLGHHGATAAPKLTSKREKGALVDGCYCSLLSWVHLCSETPSSAQQGQETGRREGSPRRQPGRWPPVSASQLLRMLATPACHMHSPTSMCAKCLLSRFSHDSDPISCSPPGSSVHGILQARILEWVALPSSRGSSRHRDQTQRSDPPLFCPPHWQAGSLPLAPPGKPPSLRH